MRFLFIGMALFTFISNALAKEAALLPQVVVHGEQESTGEGAGPSHESIKTADYERRIVTVPEILSEQAGIHLTRYGGLEDATSISIRGSQSDEVLVTVDGIPLNSAVGDPVDLAPFLIEDIEALDIYRGATPIEAGFSSTAGLVTLRSKKIGKGIHYGGSVGYGSFNTVRGSANFSTGGERFGFLLNTSFLRTDGDFTFLDDNGTPVNTADDQTVRRQNNASQTVHPFFKFYYDLTDHTRLEVLTHLIRRDKGVPGFASNQSSSANVDDTDWMTAFKLTHRNFESLAYTRWDKSQYSDLNGEIGLGGAQDNDDDTVLFGLKNSLKVAAGAHQLATIFALYQFESFAPEDFLASPSKGTVSRRHTVNVGAGDEVDLFDHRFFISPSVWFENIFNHLNNNDLSSLAPANFSNTKGEHDLSASTGFKGVITSFLSAEGHVSRSFRHPSFAELFGDRGGVVGNPLLDPQESVNWDGGIHMEIKRTFIKSPQPPFSKGGGFFSAVYFDRHVTDLIQFEQNAGFARAENVGSARMQGVEIQAGGEFFKHLGIYGNYTYQTAIDHAAYDGRFIPGQPKHELDTRLEGWLGKGRGYIALNWMDSNFLDPLNTRVVKDRLLLNSGVSLKLKKVLLAVEAKNLTNDRIVDVVGFPLPGRSFYAKADVRF